MSIEGFCNQEVRYYTRNGFDAYGKEIYEPGIVYAARFQHVTKTRFLANGHQVTIDAIAYVDGSAMKESEVPIFLVGERLDYKEVPYRIHAINSAHNAEGLIDHVKLELKKWNV